MSQFELMPPLNNYNGYDYYNYYYSQTSTTGSSWQQQQQQQQEADLQKLKISRMRPYELMPLLNDYYNFGHYNYDYYN